VGNYTVISHYAIKNSLSPLSYYNGSEKDPKYVNKQLLKKTRDITLTITETLEIITKPGNATNQSIITIAYKIGLLSTYGIKKQKDRITCKNLGQYRYCLILEYLILWYISSHVSARLNKFYSTRT
jgi:hypothetical protein